MSKLYVIQSADDPDLFLQGAGYRARFVPLGQARTFAWVGQARFTRSVARNLRCGDIREVHLTLGESTA